MALQKNLNNVIRRPWISEKATALSILGKYVFLVDPKAKSHQVRQLIEKMYGVHVTDINMVNINHAEKHERRAIVTLKKGEKIDIVPR